MSTNPPPKATKQISFFEFWSQGPRRLFRSRRAILREMYLEGADQLGIVLDRTADNSELRTAFYDALNLKERPTEKSLDQMEARNVAMMRMAFGFSTFFINVLPLSAVVFFLRPRLADPRNLTPFGLFLTLLSGLVMLIPATIVGVVLYAVMIRPFAAFMNRYAMAPQVNPYAESPTVASDSSAKTTPTQ